MRSTARRAGAVCAGPLYARSRIGYLFGGQTQYTTLQDTFDPASAAGMVSSGAGPLATAAAEPEDLKVLRAYLIDNKVDTAEAAKELGVTIAANNNALVNKNAFQKYYGSYPNPYAE